MKLIKAKYTDGYSGNFFNPTRIIRTIKYSYEKWYHNREMSFTYDPN